MKNEKIPRLLLVLEMLQRTDVEHPLNTTKIINKLMQCGVDAERKAVLRDLKALKAVEYKIIKCDNHNRSNYMEAYLFEKHELKIIADLVADAAFLTVQASTAILQKIWSLCSVSTASLLEEDSFINESNKWLLHMGLKVKILRTEELQMQFVEYVRRRYADYLEQYRL
ncbi:hypothetical protein [Ruminiclostridium cellobioparum]|uniref:hypothetical protein n=1 Tax=Ruminiclostridium cellobioparum TaxID=29355 RepID=UPI0028AD1403|nr:hypothetical protein [Ruminiclostridium cellobioparum]